MRFFHRVTYFCLGAWLSISGVMAAQTTVTMGGTRLVLNDVSAEVSVHFRGMRFNRAQNVWNFEASITNRGIRDIRGPFVVLIESFTGTSGPLQTDGFDENLPGRPFYNFSAMVPDFTLSPGEQSAERTLTLGRTTGTPQVVAKVFAAADQSAVALGFVRTLNAAGQPLTGVVIEQTGVETNSFESDPVFGVASIGTAGSNHWKFSAPGYLPAWRSELLTPGVVTLIPSPRLVPRGTNRATITVLQGGRLSAGGIQIQVPAGTLQENGEATLTPLDGQALPLLLPLGWSPLQAFWIEFTNDFTAIASLVPWGSITSGETVALVKLQATGPRWVVTELLSGVGTNAISAAISGAGAYVLVVADRPPTAPPLPQVGTALLATQFASPSGNALRAGGSVNPAVTTASRTPELITARAEVVVTNLSGALPSGLILHNELFEEYRLIDGGTRIPPRYENFMVAYQKPGDTDSATLHAAFPLRPVFLFGPEELDQATLTVNVLSAAEFAGPVINESGGAVASGRARIVAAVGDISGQQAMQLRTVNPTNFLSIAGNTIVEAAFEVAISGVAAGRRLSVQLDGAAPNSTYLLGRVLYDAGLYGIQPIERFATDAAGLFRSAEAASGDRLDGLTGAGQYVVLKTQGAQSLILGTARDSSGEVASGMPVRISGQPWLTFSGPNGAYKTIAPSGSTTISATDLASGDVGESTIAISQPVTTVNLAAGASGPRAFLLTSTTNVSRVAEIQIGFSEPINPGTFVTDAAQLISANGQVVAATMVLNLRNTVVTILPTEPLAGRTVHTVTLSTNIADFTGLNLEGSNTFSFTTESDLLERTGVELVIYQPGATNVPANILDHLPAFEPGRDPSVVVVHGTSGAAEPGQSVILLNESSGETSTVLSEADGSFYGFIRGEEADYVSAVIQNANGTRLYLPVSKQKFDDGFVGLYQQGGILEAESADRDVEIIVEPGAIESRQKIRVVPLTLQQILPLLNNTQPVGGRLLGAVEYAEEGEGLKSAADITFSVSVAELGLPQGVDPEKGSYALTIPRKFNDTVVYEVIDSMSFETTGPGQGKLVTRSPPYIGLLLRKLRALEQNTERFDALSSISLASTSEPGAKNNNSQTTMLGFISLEGLEATTIAGKVLSAEVDATGNPVGEKKPVAGAIVSVDFGILGNIPVGNFRPGELISTSDRDGGFAFALKPLDSAAARVLQAVHPRFPFKKALSPGVLPTSFGAKAVTVELLFALPKVDTVELAGITPPVVDASHTPLFPPIGLGATAGGRLMVTALDDRSITRLEATVTRVQELLGDRDFRPETVAIEVVREESAIPGRLFKEFSVKAPNSVRVTLEIIASDGEGRSTTIPYLIPFGGTAPPIQPGDTNDVRGPRVVLAWPPEGAERVASLTPILIRFNEPVSEIFLNQTQYDWISMEPNHEVISVQRTKDPREIYIVYDGETEGEVKLSIGPPLTDQNGRTFDQKTIQPGDNPFLLKFTQSGLRRGTLEEIGSGGGVVFQGAYAYALERQPGAGGRLIAYDFSQSFSFPNPPIKDRLDLDGFPTDLTLISDYSLATDIQFPAGIPTDWDCQRADYLAVFTGSATEPKRLTLVPADGDLPGFVTSFFTKPVSAVLSFSDASMILKSKWDAPFLGYLESGADVTSISLLSLNAFHAGMTASASEREQLPEEPFFGVDKNADGDFCDPEDVPPLSAKSNAQVLGLMFSYAPEDPEERIIDFDFNSAFGIVGTVFKRTDSAQTGFRTVIAGIDGALLPNSTVNFPAGEEPKRVLFLPGQTVETPTGDQVRDLALVSFLGAPGWVGVVDISVPATPVFRMRIDLPQGEGSANTIQRRADGLLVVASTDNAILLDPRKVLVPVTQQLTHPAIVGRMDGVGGGVRTYVADASGINIINSGTTHRVVQTAPHFDVVTMVGGVNLAAAEAIADLSRDAKREYVEAARSIAIAQVANIQFTDTPPTPDPLNHYYVLIRAPGGAGEKLDLAMVATSTRGGRAQSALTKPLPSILADPGSSLAYQVSEVAKFYKKVATLVSIGESLEELGNAANTIRKRLEAFFSIAGDTPDVVSGPVDYFTKVKDFITNREEYPTTLTAYRLGNDDDKSSELYNTYLAGPIILLDQALTKAQVGQLQDQLPRSYLKATPSFWVGLRPASGLDNSAIFAPYVAPFVAELKAFRQEIIIEPPSPEEFAARILFTHATGDRGDLVDPLTDYLAQDFDYILLPGAHVRKPVAISSRPAVFVPGVMGSELVDGRTPGEGGDVNFWVHGQLFTSQDSSSPDLDMNPDGTSLRENVVPSDITRKILGVMDIYEPFVSYLVNDLGYVEYDFKRGAVTNGGFYSVEKHPGLWNRTRLVEGEDALPNLTQDPIPTLFVFPYDWRLDNAVTAEKLRAFMDLVFEIHPEADKIDLIAHSMGSLVSRRFVLDHPELVERFITVGAPWMGSAKMLTAGVLGDMDEAALNVIVPKTTIRRILKNMPAPHQLMPSKGLFDLGLNPMFEAGWDVNENGIFYESYNYTNYSNTIRDYLFRDVMKEFGGASAPPSPAIQNHENFHFYQDGAVSDWRNDNFPIEYYHFIGMQSVPQSPGRIALSARLIPIKAVDNDLSLHAPPIEYFESDDSTGEERPAKDRLTGQLPIGPKQFKLVKTLEPIRTSGDGTVPILSLSRGAGSQSDRNAPNAKVFPLVSTSVKTDNLANHNGEFQNKRLHEMVAEILQGRIPDAVPVTIAGQFGESFEGQTTSLNVSFTRPPSAQGEVSVLWDFGDGGTVIQSIGNLPNSNVQHVYLDDGIYTVSCAVTYANGVAGFSSRTVAVQNRAPEVQIENGDLELPVGASPVLIARAVDAGVQDRHIFHWDFNNDGTTDFDGSFVAVPNFSAPGDYTVKVTAEDFSGGFAEDTITVRVGDGQSTPAPPQLPAPDFILPAGGPQQIELFISGHNPLFNDGVTVVSDDLLVYFTQDVPFNLLRNLASVRNDDVAKEGELLSVFRYNNDEGSPVSKTTFLTAGANQIVTIRLRYLEGGVAQKLFVWEQIIPNGEITRIHFDWQSETATVDAGGNLTPNFTIDGIAAADRNGPAIAIIENPRTDRMFIVGRDNFTPESSLTYFLGEDTDGDGQFYGETFYELTNRNYLEIAIPSRPYLVLARDAAGNISDLSVTRPVVSSDTDFTHAIAGLPAPPAEKTLCDELTGIRELVRTTVVEALDSNPIKRFLIHEDDIWFFEQGSGACLWRGSASDSCDTCDGVYKPHKSDNDYELFMPVHKGRVLTRQEFVASDPHSPNNMEGDWYFLPPVGLDAGGSIIPTFNANGALDSSIISWRYTLPVGFSNLLEKTVIDIPRPASPFVDPANPFFNPITPAQAMAFAFTQALTNKSNFKDLFAEVTFFPFRREHFQHAVMSLEKPPAFGDDPIGDAGMGRHLLLLKWLLEGTYVTFPNQGHLNDNVVSVNTIYSTLTNFTRIPVAEGYEWGVYQDFAALLAGARMHLERIDSVDGPNGQVLRSAITDDLRKQQEKIIKKVGKAGIRATLARLAGDAALQSSFLSISPSQYAAQGIPSFEHFIANVSTSGAGSQVFQGQTALINNFLRAKLADQAFIDELISERRVAEFIQQSFTFMRSTVQEATRQSYVQYMRELESTHRFSELAARKVNLDELENGFLAGGNPIPGRRKLMGSDGGVEQAIELNLRVANNGPQTAENVRITASESPTGPASQSVSSSANPTILNVRGSLSASADGDGEDPTEGDDSFERNQSTTIGSIPPNSSSSILLGETEPATGVFILEDSAHPRTRVLQLDVVGQVPGDQLSQRNNQFKFKVEMLPNAAAAPVLEDDTVALELSARTRVGIEFVGDHAPDPFGRPRSAKLRLSRTDRIAAQVTGQENASYRLKVQSESDPTGITVDFTRVVGKRFTLTEGQRIALGTASIAPGSGQPTIAIKDEELVTFTLLDQGGATVATRDCMLDRAEFSGGGLEFGRMPFPDEPRALATLRFTGGNGDDLHFFDSGSSTFPDTIGIPGPGNQHPMVAFIQNFGGNLPHSGEADILFSVTHGLFDGTLQDHDVNTLLGQNVIFNPSIDLTTQWNTDADVAILHACKALGIDDTGLGDNGRDVWEAVMRGRSKPVRIILGFNDCVGPALDEIRELVTMLDNNARILDAWSIAMNRNDNGLTPQPFAGLFFKSARDDRAYEIGARPLSTEEIRYFDAEDTLVPPTPFGASASPVEPAIASAPQVVPLRLQQKFTFKHRPVLRASALPLRYLAMGDSETLVDSERSFEHTPTVLNKGQAREIATTALSGMLSDHPGELRHTFTSARRSGSSLPGLPMNLVTNGYVVYFDHYWQGLRIDDDGFSVEITGTNITRISGTLHEPELSPEMDSGATLNPAEALNSRAITQANFAPHLSHLATDRAQLSFVKVNRFSKARPDEFVPAWNYKTPQPAPGEPPRDAPNRVWIHAVTGELLGATRD